MAGGVDGGGAADPRPEVGDDLDLRAPPVSGWPKKKRREGCVGPAGKADWAGWATSARKRGREGWQPREFAGCGEEEGKGVGPAGGKGREEREKGFLFLTLFKSIFFQTLKLQSNKKPCIRIMMRNHLLF
jgi:hypothetical protein